jgi:hypothetical protein
VTRAIKAAYAAGVEIGEIIVDRESRIVIRPKGAGDGASESGRADEWREAR